MMVRRKNALFLVHNYNAFQKSQIEAVSELFDQVYVLVRQNLLLQLLSKLAPHAFAKFRADYAIDIERKPSNITVIVVPLLYLPFSFFYKKLGEIHFNAAKKIIISKEIEFDIVHAHFLWSAGFVAVKVKEEWGIPAIVTAHGYDVYSLPLKSKSWEKRIRNVCKKADAISTPSISNLSSLRLLGYSEKVSVIPNGFDDQVFYRTSKINSRQILSLSDDVSVLLCVGNLESLKGHIFLIRAIKNLEKNYPNLICLFVGGGSQEKRLQREIRLLKLETKVKLLGPKRTRQLLEYYNAADLLIVPSLRESFGVVQIEAMACGLPIVATRNGGSEEIILDNRTGILCEPGDAGELAKAIRRGLEEKWDREMISMLSRKYTWKTLKQDFEKLYSQF